MKKMIELKKKYNELLSRYNKGVSMMAEVKGNEEKEQEYLELLKNIQLEMNDCLMKIPEYTEDETVNGFEISENVSQETETIKTQIFIDGNVVAESTNTPTVVSRQTDTINTFDSYKNNWEMAVQLSKSDLVPQDFKGKPANCIIALGIAQQTNLPPYTIMNNLNIVRGRASFSGSFCRTLIERTGKYSALDIIYIGEKGKDSYGAYLKATRKDGTVIKGPEVTIAMAKQEGWTSNKKWTTLTELMLSYRATSFFARVYEPSALNGIYTTDEVEEMNSTPREVKDVL